MEELDDIVILLRKFLADDLTDSERGRLEEWAAQHPANRDLLENLSDEANLLAGYTDYLQVYDEIASSRLKRIEDTLMKSITTSVEHAGLRKRYLRWLPYAAAILLAALAGTWFFYGNQIRRHTTEIASVQDVPPGGNRATLTLAGGQRIALDETRSSIVVRKDGIMYSDGDHLLVETAGDRVRQDEITFLELTTPVSGTYQIVLADGTQVWLNAASTLRYPLYFPGTERLVELSGEAYFSVAKDMEKPFKVISSGQEIHVLGTEFNVSAYPDDSDIKTTLVEGKVRLSMGKGHGKYVDLTPGEQGVLQKGGLTKTKVDTELYTAWKDGYFYFDRTPLKDILQQASRWYGIEIVYPNGVPHDTFSGDVRRDVTLHGFLKILQISTINVRLEERTLFVN